MIEQSLMPIGNTSIQMGERGAVIPSNVTFDDAYAAALTVLQIKSASQWAFIDIYLRSEELFGEESSQMLEDRYTHPGSVANLRHTHKHFPTMASRRWNLGVSHYSAVAVSYLTQEQKELILQEAVDNGLSRDGVRQIVAGYSPNPIRTPFQKEVFIQQVTNLITWAVEHDVPAELIEMVEVLFKEYRGEKDESYPKEIQ